MKEFIQAVKEFENFMNKYTEYCKVLFENSWRKHEAELLEFSKRRNFSVELMRELGIFYIGEMVEMLVPEYLDWLVKFGVISNTNGKPIYNKRYIIPIRHESGNIVNLVGYTWDADERYMYAESVYYSRNNTLYGLEDLDYAYDVGWAIVTEGITDCIAFKAIGIKNCFAMCGTRPSDIKMKILDRCRYGIIFVKDRDKAGDKAAKNWKVSKYVKLMVPVNCKDADEFLNKDSLLAESHRNIMLERVEACKQWLCESEHFGMDCGYRETTIMI